MKNICLWAALMLFLFTFFSCASPILKQDDAFDGMTGATKVTIEESGAITSNKVKQKVRDFLSKKRVLSLATIDALENPVTRSVVYANGDDVLYVLSLKDNKIHQIMENPNVAFDIHYYDEDWTKLQSLQMQGVATVVDDEGEKKKALRRLCEKFEQYASMPTEKYDFSIIKIKPTKGIFIDNPSGYGTRYEVDFE